MFHLSIFCAKSTHFVNLTFIIYLWSDVCHLSARYLYIVFKTIIRSSCCNQLQSNNSRLKITTLILASLIFTCIYDLFLYYHSINQMSIFFLSTPIYFILLFVISQTIMFVVLYCLFIDIYTNELVSIKSIYYAYLLCALRVLPLFCLFKMASTSTQEVLLASINHQLLTLILAAHKKRRDLLKSRLNSISYHYCFFYLIVPIVPCRYALLYFLQCLSFPRSAYAAKIVPIISLLRGSNTAESIPA